MRKLLFLVFWLGCWYMNVAVMAGDLCTEFCGTEHYWVETPRKAIRESIVFGALGPLAVGGTMLSWAQDHPIWWDWPRRYREFDPEVVPLKYR